jgi:lipopolysaccharide/colanic/teichoic acid biosynthesis glycosyltransferase
MVLGKRKMEKPEDTAEPVEPNNFLYLVVDKRLIDVVIATPTFILSLPLIAILALLVRLQAKGPVFERFAGYGPDGKELSLVRFNTSDPADRNRKVDYYWRRNAARTPLNDFLIRSGLDRLPGLIAVIRGDFSLVGPELTTFRKEKKLYWVRPGLTSLARLNGNAHAYGLGESADEFYIRSLRFGLDLRLMVKSVQLIVSAAL